MALALRNHFRSPVDPAPERRIREQIQNRGANFLSLVRPALSNPEHPYSQLFALAGCTFGDLECSVRRDGLEGALRALLAQGVYVTHDEYRGRAEIVRGGRHIPSSPADWINQRGKGEVVTSSSGTSGRSVQTGSSLEMVVDIEGGLMVMLRDLRMTERTVLNIGPILPGFGLLLALVNKRMGLNSETWYAPAGGAPGNAHYRVATRLSVSILRLSGARIPYPVYLPPNEFGPIVDELARCHAKGEMTAVGGFVSAVTRVAADAKQRGIDLSGCCAIVTGEALTDAKRNIMEAAGITPYSTYGASDMGSVGYPCASMTAGNCVHVFTNGVALTTRRSQHDPSVDALCFTSLLPYAPRVLINVEMGDTGILEEAPCRCSLSALGLTTQVRNIAAFSKVTAQGITIDVADLVRILEETIPGRFGGGPDDYQLIEKEGAAQSEAELRIRPGVTAADPQQVLDFFLSETRRLYGGSMTVLSWTQSDGIHVVVAAPILAGTGKFRSVRLLGAGVARSGTPASKLG